MNKWRISLLILAALLLVALTSCLLRRQDSQVQAEIVSAASPGTVGADPAGFKRVEGPKTMDFPDDSGPHTDYQTEWWYYTGNLYTTDGRQFGYQLTFFRRGLL